MTDQNQSQAGALDALDVLETEAAAFDGKGKEPTPQQQREAVQSLEDATNANREIMAFVWDAAEPFIPEDIAARYDAEKRDRIAVTWTVLAAKRGWDIGALLGEWGPEIAFGAALIGPAVPLLVARWKARREAQRVSHQ